MKNVDFTNPKQKVIAGILMVVTGIILYGILPPLNELLKNIWITIAYLVPMVIVVANYGLIWKIYKQLVWKATKGIIATDKLAYMYQYHTYLLEKIQKLELNTRNITSARIKLDRRLQELLAGIEKNKKDAEIYISRGYDESNVALKSLYNKINIDTTQANNLAPKLKGIEEQEKYLLKLTEHWTEDAEGLKYTLDAKADEYNILKEVSEAVGNASAFLKGNTQEYKMFEESLKQIETDVTIYTANIETFERKIAPILEGKISNKQISEEEGRKLVEEFMRNTESISFKNE